MDYDFSVDSEGIDALVDEASEKLAILNQLIINLYDSFNTLPSREIWGGPVYDAFMSGPDLSAKILKEDYLDHAIKALSDFLAILNAVSANATDLVNGTYNGTAAPGGCGGGGAPMNSNGIKNTKYISRV